MQEALEHAHDLARLYIYYHVEPGLQGKLWRDVAPGLSEEVAKFKDQEISKQELDTYIAQNFPRVSIPIADLQRLNHTRHELFHTYVLLHSF
jgi:hypothetical protein